MIDITLRYSVEKQPEKPSIDLSAIKDITD